MAVLGGVRGVFGRDYREACGSLSGPWRSAAISAMKLFHPDVAINHLPLLVATLMPRLRNNHNAAAC